MQKLNTRRNIPLYGILTFTTFFLDVVALQKGIYP